jgi:hypothetical protein
MLISAEEISKRKFGKLRIRIPQDIMSGSHKKTEWVCDCGKYKSYEIWSVISGHTTSCNGCNLISAEEMTIKKFGKLRIKIPKDILPGSTKKVLWICDCGKEKFIKIMYVTSGQSTSCGRCSQISAAEIATRKFGKLRIKIPQDINPGSAKKVEWICDCGREVITSIYLVISGNTSSCGRCNQISAEEIFKRKFGKLRIKNPQDIMPGSEKKIEWICDCGKEKLIQINYITSGQAISCNQCNQIAASEMAIRKFGRLRAKIPQDVTSGSKKKILWICDCGRKKLISIYSVISGYTISCGDCGGSVKNWYIQNREQIRSLKCPIDPKNFIPGGIIPLETIKNVSNPFKAICPACKKEYHPRFDGIRLGKSLTCGCASYRVSMPCLQIIEYIKSLGFKVISEHKVNNLYYDIFVPFKNSLIEFQGIRWHSMKGSKEKDLRKRCNATDAGYNFMEIHEMDWKNERDDVKKYINQFFDFI